MIFAVRVHLVQAMQRVCNGFSLGTSMFDPVHVIAKDAVSSEESINDRQRFGRHISVGYL
jgi:hypothetical protein